MTALLTCVLSTALRSDAITRAQRSAEFKGTTTWGSRRILRDSSMKVLANPFMLTKNPRRQSDGARRWSFMKKVSKSVLPGFFLRLQFLHSTRIIVPYSLQNASVDSFEITRSNSSEESVRRLSICFQPGSVPSNKEQRFSREVPCSTDELASLTNCHSSTIKR